MSVWRQLTRGLRVLANRENADKDVADEVEHYLEEAAAALQATGLSPEDARRAARLELGGATVVRETVRGYGWENVVDTLAADVRYGIRRLRRSPGFSAVAALTLALGIGASTAIFSAVNPVLLQPLPYPDAGRLMMIWDRETRMNVTFGTYREVVQRNRSFEALAVMRRVQATLTGVAEPERFEGQYVSASYFRVLGVRPALGRDFHASDDRPGAPFVVLISDGLWRRRFGADRGVVGRQIALEGTPVTVVGVMPREFENVLSPAADIWSPLQFDEALPVNGREWGRNLRMVGRLAHGVHPDQARHDLDTIARTRLAEFPRASLALLEDGFIATRLQDDLTGTVRPVLVAVVGAVGLLLTIACVNVSNLLLGRGAARRTELAVRAALGASRWRLVRQLLVETVLLAVFGGVLGMLLARAAVEAVVALSPPELTRAGGIAVDGTVLAFAVGLTMLVGLVIGIVPALHGSAAGFLGGVQQRSMRIAGGHRFTRPALVVVQLALALVLLVGAGLLLRSLQHLFAVPPGFDPADLLTMQVQVAGREFRDDHVTHQFFTHALEAVRQVPGVAGAAFTSQLPLTGEEDLWGVHVESFPSAADEDPDAYRYAVSPGYFEAMGIPLRQGRVLNAHDSATVPPAVVINESFARRRLPGLNPIGKRLRIGPSTGFTVVGVVADVKQTSLAIGRGNAVYMTAAQWPRFADRARWLVVRAQRDAATLTPAIRRAIRSVDPNQPILRVATMDERLRASEVQRRFALFLFEAFGVVALVLSAIGTYSLLAGSVTERTREIGVRSALGASRRSILALVLRQGMTPSGLGIAIGLAGATVASRALETLLFDVSRLDAATYLGVVALLVGASAIACGVPAWRAAQVRPSIALRSE